MKHLSAILALVILLTVGLACSDSGGEQTNAANSTEKKDSSVTTEKKDSSGGITVDYVTMKNAEDETVTSFKPSDRTQKIAVQLSETAAGKVKGIFTAVNAGGEKNFKLTEKEVELGTLMNTATFSLTLDRDFPIGDYKLDVYAGDKLIKTHDYKVQ